MSKNYNDCDVTLELLPLYIEKKTGEESNLFVGKHLLNCEECQQVYQLMAQELVEDIWSMESISQRTGHTKKRRFIRRIKTLFVLLGGMIAYIALMIGIIALVVMYLS